MGGPGGGRDLAPNAVSRGCVPITDGDHIVHFWWAEIGDHIVGDLRRKGGNMKQTWVTPKLASKPVSQTLSGVGSNQDGRGGEFQS